MTSKNSAKYGSELARLLLALTANLDNLDATKGTICDILDKIGDMHPKENSVPLAQFYEDCGFEAVINLLQVINGEDVDDQLYNVVLKALRIVNGLRKLRSDHWQSLPYQEVMISAIVKGLESENEHRQLYAAATLSGITVHYSEYVKHNLPKLLMKMYNSDSQDKLLYIVSDADYLKPTTNRAAASHAIMKFYQSKAFYQTITNEGFVRRTMDIVCNYQSYEEDLLFCVIRYFLFSCLIHSRNEMKKVEKELGVDFFTKILPGIGETYESQNPQIQEIIRSSCKVVSAQAIKFGHMLTPEAGSTQWMEEHDEEACALLRKPLDIKRKCSNTGCTNVEAEIGQYDRCSACKVTVYCASECQKSHWSEKHKKLCKRLRKAYQLKEVKQDEDLD